MVLLQGWERQLGLKPPACVWPEESGSYWQGQLPRGPSSIIQLAAGLIQRNGSEGKTCTIRFTTRRQGGEQPACSENYSLESVYILFHRDTETCSTWNQKTLGFLSPQVLHVQIQPSTDPKYLKKESCTVMEHIQTFFLNQTAEQLFLWHCHRGRHRKWSKDGLV